MAWIIRTAIGKWVYCLFDSSHKTDLKYFIAKALLTLTLVLGYAILELRIQFDYHVFQYLINTISFIYIPKSLIRCREDDKAYISVPIMKYSDPEGNLIISKLNKFQW